MKIYILSCLLFIVTLAPFCTAGTLGIQDYSIYRDNSGRSTFRIQAQKLSMQPSPEKKEAFWKQLEDSGVPVILQLFFEKNAGEKHNIPPFETAKKQIDEWFSKDGAKIVVPSSLYGVTLAEENITWEGQADLQERIARYLKETYAVRTFHWLSEPLLPSPKMKGDGWIFDAYSVDHFRFWHHIESFLLTGKEVLPVIWASGHFANYHKNLNWEQLTLHTQNRLQICRFFQLPVILFAVAGKQGSVSTWFSPSSDEGEQMYRTKILQMLDGTAPVQPHAKFTKVIPANIFPDGSFSFQEDANSYGITKWVNFQNVRDWEMTPDGLALRAANGVLSFQCHGSGTIANGTLKLHHSNGACGTINGRELDKTAVSTAWTVEKTRDFEVVLKVSKPFVLKKIEFSGRGEFVTVPKKLSVDKNGVMHGNAGLNDKSFLPSLSKISNEKASPSISPKRIGLPGAAGAVSRAVFIQEVELNGTSGIFSVDAEVFADSSNYGGKVQALLTADGTTPLAEFTTDRSKKAQKIHLECQVPAGTAGMKIVWKLSVGCGVDTKTLCPAYFNDYKITFSPEAKPKENSGSH